MTHKQRCIGYCLDYLHTRNLAYTYSHSVFQHYYRKFHGHNGNPYLVGMNAGDMMIQSFNQNEKEVVND